MDGKKLPCVLVENKADLLSPSEAENLVSLKGFANANNCIGSFRTSAKTGLNIDESMSFLIEHIVERMKAVSSKDFSPDRNSCTLDPQKHALQESFRQEKSGGCC